ncbi:MAG: single-stranded DNA-binding protein [Saprospiraceae bacterium]|nr:single-stranded DNA-binding protein [Saprospiraceae bacterium]
MSVINKVQLLGHLGKEPIVKTLSTGKMARFSLATDESYLNREGNRVENTQWHNLVAWGEVAEQVEQSLKKGSRIQLYGKIANRSFETKEGVKKYSTEIVVTGFELA